MAPPEGMTIHREAPMKMPNLEKVQRYVLITTRSCGEPWREMEPASENNPADEFDWMRIGEALAAATLDVQAAWDAGYCAAVADTVNKTETVNPYRQAQRNEEG